MSDKMRRLQSIELGLKPRQMALLWLRKARQAGDFEHAAHQSPPPRGVLANAVWDSVHKAMKGQPETLIEQVVRQARQEADHLYILAGDVNVSILESRNARKREALMVRAHFLTLLEAPIRENSMEHLRSALVTLIDEVVLTAEKTKRITAENFGGQDILFSDARLELEDQIDTMLRLCAAFNHLATRLRQPLLNFQRIREDLQPTIEKMVSAAVDIAWEDTLSHFGDEASRVSAMLEFSKKYAPSPRPSSDDRDKVLTKENPELPKHLAELLRQARTQLQLDATA